MGFSTIKYAVSEEEYNQNVEYALGRMAQKVQVNPPKPSAVTQSGVEPAYVDSVEATLKELAATLCEAKAYPYYEKGEAKKGDVVPYDIKFSVYKTKDAQPKNKAKATIGSKTALEMTFDEEANLTEIRVSTTTKEISKDGSTYQVADGYKPFDEAGVKIPVQFRAMLDFLKENGFENEYSSSRGNGNYKYDIPEAVRKVFNAYKEVVRARDDKTADGKFEYYMSSTGEKDEEGNYYDDKIRPISTKDGETYYQFSIRNHGNQALQIAINEDGKLRSGSMLDYNDIVDDGNGNKSFKEGGNIYRTNLEMLNGIDSTGFGAINKAALAKVGYQPPEQPKDKSKDGGKDER
jgi:hypothetical protein